MYLNLVVVYIYRPQTKFAKVMFLHISVCPRGGGGLQAHTQGEVEGSGGRVSRPTPRGEVEESGWLGGVSRPTPRGEVEGPGWGEVSRSTSRGGVSQHALRQTPPPPKQTATAPGGTHPTGMHSCSINILLPNDLIV